MLAAGGGRGEVIVPLTLKQIITGRPIKLSCIRNHAPLRIHLDCLPKKVFLSNLRLPLVIALRVRHNSTTPTTDPPMTSLAPAC